MERHKLAGLGDGIIHRHFDIAEDILWDRIQNWLPDLRQQTHRIEAGK